MSSMSLSWIAAQPRMDEPSMPKPSSNDDSENCSMGKETWCQSPGRSVKRRSSSLAPFFLANSSTVLGSVLLSAIQVFSPCQLLKIELPLCTLLGALNKFALNLCSGWDAGSAALPACFYDKCLCCE